MPVVCETICGHIHVPQTLLNITHCAKNYGISMWQHVIKDRCNSQNNILKFKC